MQLNATPGAELVFRSPYILDVFYHFISAKNRLNNTTISRNFCRVLDRIAGQGIVYANVSQNGGGKIVKGSPKNVGEMCSGLRVVRPLAVHPLTGA